LSSKKSKKQKAKEKDQMFRSLPSPLKNLRSTQLFLSPIRGLKTEESITDSFLNIQEKILEVAEKRLQIEEQSRKDAQDRWLTEREDKKLFNEEERNLRKSSTAFIAAGFFFAAAIFAQGH